MAEKEKKIAWEAYEYRFKKKSPDWFWALGIVAVSFAVTAVIFNNILFAVFILLGAFTLAMYAQRPPRRIVVLLTSRGIITDNKLRSYNELDSFWVEDRDGNARILIKSKSILAPLSTIPIEGIRSDDIREYLAKFLPEEEHMEPISQKILEYFGF